MLRTKFTELTGCRVPIQQAGMDPLANPRLAAAVSEAGGLGMVSLSGLLTSKVTTALEEVRRHTSGVFGANFLIPEALVPELGEIHGPVGVASRLAKVVEFFYRQPDRSLVKLVHDNGALVFWQVGSKEEAVAAADVGCDAIIAQGIEAGGHIRGRIGLIALLTQVLDSVRIPVIAAGGIGSGQAMAAALVAGASGVRVGTRFVAAEEAGAHPDYLKALVRSNAEDTIFTDAFSRGWPNAPHRVLRSCVEAAEAFKGDVVGHRYNPLTGETVTIRPFEPRTPTKETTGSVEAMPLWAGESVGGVKRLMPAAAIVNELVTEAEKLLRQWT